jgi:DNA-binding GntR family transcriptional regulator
VSTTRIEIEQRSASEQIAHGLRDMILRGELAPGEPIRESVLASDLGVSRNTVREAVRILERTGLTSYEMNRGASVRQPSRPELEDLYTARLAIEIGAAQVAPLAEAGEPLFKAYEKLEQAIDRGIVEDAVRADMEFHSTAVAVAGSKRLDVAFQRILNELQLYLAILSKAEGEYAKPEQVTSEHKAILGAYQSGEVTRVIDELTVHVRDNAARLARILP